MKISVCTPLNVYTHWDISSRRKSLGLGSYFSQQNQHISVKKIKRMDHMQYCACKYTWWHLVYICIYIYFDKFCPGITPINSRAKGEYYMKAWNYIKNDCDQETDKGYSTIVKIIVKNDRGKATAWHPVSCKMTYNDCYHVSEKKKQYKFSVCILYPVCSLHFLPSLYYVPGLQSAFCNERIGFAVFVRASLKSSRNIGARKKILAKLSWPL